MLTVMTIDELLVAYDGSPASDEALAAALELASRTRAHVTVCHALDVAGLGMHLAGSGAFAQPWAGQLHDDAENVLGQAETRAEERGAHVDTVLLEGPTVPGILELADRLHASAIMVGSRGRSALGRLLMGSVADAIVRRAGCPVMVVPPAKTAGLP